MSATGAVIWGVTGASPLTIIEFLMTAQPGPDLQGLAVALSYYMMVVNLLLAVFNLLPFPFFDGFQALMSLFAMVRHALRGRKGQPPLPAVPVTWRRDAETGSSPARIHFDIGLDYHKEGQLDEAIARYRQATGHDDRFALAYYNLGLAYWAKGRLPLAISAFRAAAGSRGDPGLSMQANLRVRELTRAEQDPSAAIAPAPPPLEPDTDPAPAASGAPALDPDLARRVRLQLIIGGAVMAALALAMWVYVTAVALISVG
jgi:tetratricopeptide (TPR) repeat protein